MMPSLEKQGHQLTDTVVMVSPDYFGFNPETAASNPFQTDPVRLGFSEIEIRNKAKKEFSSMAKKLKQHGINIIILGSPKDTVTPDAVFPNNWMSHHENASGSGQLIIYPMLTPNRRAERQFDNLKEILHKAGIGDPDVLDLTPWEQEGLILEGTGSLVLDRTNKVAFAMESARTTKQAFEKWCLKMGYQGVLFQALDKAKKPIYHTNVAMSLGEGFAVVCLESVSNTKERSALKEALEKFDREIINLSLNQIYSFAGNILHLKNSAGHKKIILSKTALNALSRLQKSQLRKYGELVAVDIPTIELVGGGSARCMLAEIFPRIGPKDR